MEILTFIFLILNIILLVANGFLLYQINMTTLKASKQLIYSDFWEKGDLENNDLYS